MKLYFFIFILFLFTAQVKAQLGFCSGSKGDPIFHEDFGSGSGTGAPFAPGITSYTFIDGGDPNDGEYTISDQIGTRFGSWYDYLPQTTISNGRALIVNADFTAGRFDRTEISGLCENTTYEFSAFLMNVHRSNTGVCPGGDIPINVRFEIWDESDSILLKEGNTGDINSTPSAMWEQYALTFSSEPGQDTVILKMFNNGEGGCGNDLAIDDIIFRSCGDLTTITSSQGANNSYTVCEENTPASLILNAVPDNSVYEQHFFQWQESTNAEDWQDLPGATSSTYEATSLNSSTFFRVKVAEDRINLISNVCSSASEAFQVRIAETPTLPQSNGDITICSDENIPPLSVNVGTDETVNWYDSGSGGNLLAENTSTFTPQTEGIYYAEAVKENFECAPGGRTAVQLTINDSPDVNDESLQICPDSSLTLDAGVAGMQYEWNTGETSQQISIDSPGTYTVEVETLQNCSKTKNIVVEPVDNAAILEVVSEEESVTIVPVEEGDFLYSLNGMDFQESNYFESVPGGIYTAYIKDLQNCNIDMLEFPHIVVPKFITPNGDGYNDAFELKGIRYFESSQIYIFDRYGKLLISGNGETFSWKGKFDQVDLPADDYWYVISIHGYPDRKGHFSLIR